MAWTDTIFKFIGRARFNTITPSLANGESCEAQCDSSGRLLVSTQPVNTLWADAGAVASERVIKATSGKLHQLFGRNTGASDKYLFIFNHASSGTGRPADGSTAEMFVPVRIKAGEAFSIELPRAREFATGLYWAVSSTDATFTYDAAGTFAVSAEYE